MNNIGNEASLHEYSDRHHHYPAHQAHNPEDYQLRSLGSGNGLGNNYQRHSFNNSIPNINIVNITDRSGSARSSSVENRYARDEI